VVVAADFMLEGSGMQAIEFWVSTQRFV